ncbi:TLDc domain-containing protein [Entamoeba marina]
MKGQFNTSYPLENILKYWSHSNQLSVIFDSDLHGNGYGTLFRAVYNKNNLYFIHFDNNDNIYGGYLFSTINKVNKFIEDPKAFVFSLVKNGDIKKETYLLTTQFKTRAFCLFSENSNHLLLQFGCDICAYEINRNLSNCKPLCYDYNGIDTPFVGTKNTFSLQRLIVVQMCDT